MAGTKSFVAKPGQIEEKWHVVDATDKVVGRLASDIAMILMGKHRPTYTPHVLCGDAVVVTNAEKVHFSGTKWEKKEYTWFTGYTGLRAETAERRLPPRRRSSSRKRKSAKSGTSSRYRATASGRLPRRWNERSRSRDWTGFSTR